MSNLIFILVNNIRNKFWKFFGTITLGVRVIAHRDREVLLVQHTYKPNWHLPGGGVKRKETLADAANRELYEETGAKVENLDFLGMFLDFAEGRSDHIALFAGAIATMDGIKSYEIAEAKFFSYEDLPWNTDFQCRQRIREFIEAKKNFPFINTK